MSMSDNISPLAAAFLATWQSDASPMMRAALVELLREVQVAERQRCATIALGGSWDDGEAIATLIQTPD